MDVKTYAIILDDKVHLTRPFWGRDGYTSRMGVFADICQSFLKDAVKMVCTDREKSGIVEYQRKVPQKFFLK